jgi:ABC-type transport system involved in multi-copper enzyme maturation permease subunit
MRSLLRAARWEWFKLRRRRMSWVLLLLLVAVSQSVIWATFAVALNVGRRAGAAAPALAALTEVRDALTLPGSITTAMLPVRQVVLLFLAFLSATVVGGDYALGTYRPIVAGGLPRWALLGGKLAMVAGASFAAFVVLAAATAASSLAVAVFIGLPPAPPASWDRWVEAGRILATTWSGLLPFVALTALLTVLTRSTAVAIPILAGYIFLEPLLGTVFPAAGELFARAVPYLPLRLLAVWNGPPSLSFTPSLVSRTDAAIGLSAYTVVFAAAALWRFQRRDLTSAAAG